MINITVEGAKELKEFLSKAPREIRKAAHEGIEEIAQKVEETAKRLCPVRTGYLRSTIYSRPFGFMQAEVGATAAYAVFVEFGTSYMAPRSFLRPAVISVQHEFAPTLARKVEEYLKSLR